MLISIAALGKNRVIGMEGRLPWHLPGDLRHFRELTRGGIVIMGRTTFASIGRPLPQRENWVLSRTVGLQLPGVRVFPSLETLLQALDGKIAWVIGGEQVYRQLLPHCDRQVLTEVEAEPEGDSYYPEFSSQEWLLADVQGGPSGEEWPYRFCRYERISLARARRDGVGD